MIVPLLRPLETIARTCLLGVRLRDSLRQAAVSEGFGVQIAALTAVGLGRWTALQASRSGVFAAHAIPGLHAAEFELPEAQDSSPLASPRNCLLLVQDARARYLDFCLRLTLPDAIQPMRLVCDPDLPIDSPIGSPLDHGGWVPLFPTPAYPISVAAFAVVRAHLREGRSGPFAAWAMLEAWQANQRIARAVADSEGRVLMVFPYPGFPRVQMVSPAGLTGVSIHKQQWPLELRVRYRFRDAQTGMARPVWRQAPQAGAQPVPDLCEILNQQSASFLMPDSSTVSSLSVTLRYAEELSVAPGPESTLPIQSS